MKFSIRDVRWLTVVFAMIVAIPETGRSDESVDLKEAEDVAAAEVLDSVNWGDLNLRFVYDGTPPKPKVIAKAFGPPLGLDESLAVNAKDQGIANIVVWLRHDARAAVLPVHPSYAGTAAKDIALSIAGDTLVPRVSVLRTTQKLAITNADPHGHDVRSELFDNTSFNHLLRAGESVRFEFPNPEVAPARVDDSCKPWVTGFLHVRDNPYYGVTDSNGGLSIAKVPKGHWTFVVWHERTGYVKQATLGGKSVKWERGRVSLDIKPGENDLGEIKLTAELLDK